MPFNTLLLTCLVHGTRFSENGGQVHVKPSPGETVLFFVVDEQANPRSALRRDCKIDGAVCDGIVFYTRGEKQVMCLVELKGCDLDRAAEQVINTWRSLQSSFKSLAGKDYARRLEWRAFIFKHGSAPRDTKRIMKSLIEAFGKGNCYIGGNSDLGQFLRE